MPEYSLDFRKATQCDYRELGALNFQLIQDEGHRNKMTVAELEKRMKAWLKGVYEAVIFEIDRRTVAYALYQVQSEQVYLRQFFVTRDHRRKGIGKNAFQILKTRIWPYNYRILVGALWTNEPAIRFWKAVGFKEYSVSLEIGPDDQPV